MDKDTTTRQITLARTSSSIEELRNFVRGSLELSQLDEYSRGLVSLAIDEVMTAIVQEPISNSAPAINIKIEMSPVAVKIEIEDTKNVFANGVTDDKYIETPQEGGGRREIDIYFICEIMDEIRYTYHKGFENRFLMVKFIR